MKRLFSIATAGFALALTAAAPTFAKADDHGRARVETRVETRVEHRDDHREVRVDRDDHRAPDRFDRDVHVDRRVEVRHDVHVGINIGPAYRTPPIIVDRVPVYIDRDCDLSVGVASVPACVLDTVRCEAPGRVESVRFIRDGGHEFYRVLVDARGGDLAVRIDLGGHLLGIDRC